MPWTGSRSRDEWLAEVRRRGERIRRRRWLATVVVGALALAMPVGVVATLLGARSDRGVELTATAPGPAVGGEGSAPTIPTTVAGGDTPALSGATAEQGTPPSGGVSPPTTAEVHGRVASVNGSPPPPSPTSGPPADDPVVRAAPAAPSGNSGSATGAPSVPGGPPGASTGSGAASGGLGASPSAPGPPAPAPTDDPPPAPCPAADVDVTVTTEKGAYAPGETVTGSSSLVNRSATTCLLPTRAFFRILDARGRTVSSFAYTMELRMPVEAEPGRTVTSGFTWDQQDCSGSSCAQVPAGTYVAVADWSETGPYTGRVSFRITP